MFGLFLSLLHQFKKIFITYTQKQGHHWFCQKWKYLPVSHQSHLKEPRVINCERLTFECAYHNMDQSPRCK
jgi:hypothetical protein